MKQHLMDIWRRRFPEPLIAAFDSVPRELFVLPANAHDAYGDFPLPILYGQTISQPSTVMLMINALALCLDYKVLEVGAGSGYCAAIMSRLCREVVATDIISGLVVYARQNLKKAGVTNVKVLHADGRSESVV